MGFIQGLGRVLRGEPVFQVTQAPKDDHSQQSSQDAQLPQVNIVETDSHVEGSHLRVKVRIENQSNGRIELDKIRLLNKVQELDVWVGPHEERECTVYEGPLLTQRNYDDAWLEYKDASGDYLQQYHTVEFQQATEGFYSVKYIRPSGHVRDI